MATSEVETYGLMNRWPVYMHESIWRFNQIDGLGVEQNTCGNQAVYIKYERDYIASALNRAVVEASEYLGYLPAPTYVEGEDISLDLTQGWDNQLFTLKYGYVQQIGKRVELALSEAPVTVTYSDKDGDGIDDWATITILAAFPASEIKVFYSPVDSMGSHADPAWEITGLKITDNGGGGYTIEGHKALFTHPLNVWRKEITTPDFQNKYAGDTQTSTDFVETVEVYRIWYDADYGVEMYNFAGELISNLQGTIQDSRYAQIGVRKANDADPSPDEAVYARVNYVAGLPLQRGQMPEILANALIRYANTKTPQQVCYCDRALSMWKNDSKVPETLAQVEVDNPPAFGLTNAGLNLAAVVEAFSLKYKGREMRKWPNAEQNRHFQR